MIPTHTFSVSEVLKDGRVLVFTYVHIGEKITAVMDVYDNQEMANGKRYMDVQLTNGETVTPKLGKGDVNRET